MTTEQVEIVHVAIGDLRPDPANPRKIGDAELETLARSIREFGFVDPVIARREDRVVIGGHQRLLAARKLGIKTVPVVLVDVTADQAHLLNLALNKISGDWDEDLLARMLADLSERAELDLSLSGFSDEELKKSLKRLESFETRERIETFDLDAALEAAGSATVARTGDVFALGEHRLLCGDSTASGEFERLMNGERAAVTFTDPPYNVDYGNHGGAAQEGKRRKIQNDNLGRDFEDFILRACGNMLQATDGAIYICMSSSELHTLQRAFTEAGGHWSTFVIWAKNTFTIGRSDYQRQYEPILYGWREGAKHHWCGDRDQGDVWFVDKPLSSPLHPTMKPLELIERAINNSSSVGDIVLDPFHGSGSTLIACERTGRTCYGVEIDPKYIDVAVARWESFTGQKAVKIETEKRE